jgi:hypothetical protein
MNEPTPAVAAHRSVVLARKDAKTQRRFPCARSLVWTHPPTLTGRRIWRAKTQRRSPFGRPLRLPRPPTPAAPWRAETSSLCAFAPLRDPLLLPKPPTPTAPWRAETSSLCAFAPLRDPLLLPKPPPAVAAHRSVVLARKDAKTQRRFRCARSLVWTHPPTLTGRRIWRAKTQRRSPFGRPLRLPTPPTPTAPWRAETSSLCAFAPLRDPLLLPKPPTPIAPWRAETSSLCVSFAPVHAPDAHRALARRDVLPLRLCAFARSFAPAQAPDAHRALARRDVLPLRDSSLPPPPRSPAHHD